MLFKFLRDSNNEIEANKTFTNASFGITTPMGDVYTIDNLIVCFTHLDQGVHGYGGILPGNIHLQINGENITEMPIQNLIGWRRLGATLNSNKENMQIILPLNIILNGNHTFNVVLDGEFSHLHTHTFFVTGFIN